MVNNFFAAKRVPLTTAVASLNQKGIRSRSSIWGSFAANAPKMSDDNSTTDSLVMFVCDSVDPQGLIQVDAGFGRVPADFDAAFKRLSTGIATAQGND